jgi:hypothetical protein
MSTIATPTWTTKVTSATTGNGTNIEGEALSALDAKIQEFVQSSEFKNGLTNL